MISPCVADIKNDEESLLTLAVQFTRVLVTSLLLVLLVLCYST